MGICRRPAAYVMFFLLFLLCMVFAAGIYYCGSGRSRQEKTPEEALLKARQFVGRGRYADAESHFETALIGLDHRLEVYRELADVQVALGRVREAEENLFKGLRIAKASPKKRYDAWLHLAEIRNRQGKHNEALEALDEARKLDSGRPEAAWRMARLYESFKHPETARAIYGAAAAQSKGKPGESQTFLKWALMEKRSGNLEAAENLLKKGVSLKTGNKRDRASIYLALGELYYEKFETGWGKISESPKGDSVDDRSGRELLLNRAGKAFEKASSIEPGKADVWLGRVFAALGKCDRAVAPLERALENRPEDADAAGLLAQCLAIGENPKQDRNRAYNLALKSHTLSPKDPGIMLLLAELHLENGLEKPALDILDRLVDLPGAGQELQNTAGYWILRGKALSASGNFLEALDSFSRAVAISPHDYKALRLQALALAGSGAYDRAVESLRAVRKKTGKDAGQADGKDPEVELQLAVSLEMTGRRREALDVLLKLKNDFPEKGFIPAYLGWIYLRAGQTEKALVYAERGVKMQGESLLHSLDVLAQSQLQSRLFKEAEVTAERGLVAAEKKEERAYFKKLLVRVRKESRKSDAEAAPKKR